MKKNIVIIGPTASGKSDLSLQLAKQHQCSVISADAFQIYKEFTIGTGKLNLDDQNGVTHFLIDELHPETPYSVQDFLIKVNSLYTERPSERFIICGGSAMYIKSLLYGYQPLKRLPSTQRPEGTPQHLWDQLHAIDPDLAQKTPYQNKQRVQRYLELYQIYGKPPSSLFKSSPMDSDNYQVMGILIENTILKDRINQRVDCMINKGLVDEVDYLMKKYDSNSQGFQAIGYKEPIAYLQGKISKDTMIQLIKKNSFQYAKRQMTWFRTFDNVHWIPKK
ncbi:MAG: tRNA (adenosine(37)-N6)-dimethylallyltransferase MiaA [Candidatus Margulisiibacteriota bacterium]